MQHLLSVCTALRRDMSWKVEMTLPGKMSGIFSPQVAALGLSEGITFQGLKQDHGSDRALRPPGADVNTKDQSGDVPLHIAAWALKPCMYNTLLDLGAQVNALDKYRRTVADQVKHHKPDFSELGHSLNWREIREKPALLREPGVLTGAELSYKV
ncbi:hypothetical protein BCR34DRAFT_561345 [Clohesyomyces aquaticus]|uniref:Uncharacterized protein n=1 Tax=Clohesyomyces aquaticus TaxID=1231657 RepID=A0A1Y1ZU54_9PLEO|nr:hypothetical protein BCR34DRAFT_561345 [Clohesyomyces aquaticus]